MFGIFRPFQINHVCENCRPHGSFQHTALSSQRFPCLHAGLPGGIGLYRALRADFSCEFTAKSDFQMSAFEIGTGQKGSVRRGPVKNRTVLSSGFFPGRYGRGTCSVRHDITKSPTFYVLSPFPNTFFPGFNRFFFRVLKIRNNLVQFSPTPSMADPFWRSPIRCAPVNERRRKFTTKVCANLVFQACISFLRCFRKGNLNDGASYISFLRRFRQEWRISVFALLA